MTGVIRDEFNKSMRSNVRRVLVADMKECSNEFIPAQHKPAVMVELHRLCNPSNANISTRVTNTAILIIRPSN
jgi:hypothetical protein